MKNLIALILCLLLIILVITLVLRKGNRKPTGEARRVPVLFKYHVRMNQDRSYYAFSSTLRVWILVTRQSGDTVRFVTPEKHFLSEHRNLINAVTGEVEYENVALISEIVTYEKVRF
jgi:hypothetical protein